jgi:hypothetical protein
MSGNRRRQYLSSSSGNNLAAVMVLAVGIIVMLCGCIVTSVCPFYKQTDVVFEPALVGDWAKKVTDAEDEVWKFEKNEDASYRFTLIEDRKATVMQAHAFKLQGQLFLDLFSLERDVHVIPPHYLLKVDHLAPTLRMYELNNDWLKMLLAKDPASIQHHIVRYGDNADDWRVVLTANTGQLQAFVIKHLANKDAWKDEFELRPRSTGAAARSKSAPYAIIAR